MKLEWNYGKNCPATTEELAALIRAEKRLGRGHYFANGLRCAYGVLLDCGKDGAVITPIVMNRLTSECTEALGDAGFSTFANDNFVGTPEERCEHMAQILDRIP